MKVWLGKLLIRLGMAILPKDIRQMAIDLIMYHAPNALSEERRAEIRAARNSR